MTMAGGWVGERAGTASGKRPSALSLTRSEWLYEAGIGETRAALVEHGEIVEARIEREASGPRAGAILTGRLIRALPESGRALVRLPDGGEALLDRLPPRTSEGAALRIAITREAIPEAGNPKPPNARLARDDETDRDGPDLLARIEASRRPIRIVHAHQPDALDAAGWSEVLEQAASGLIPFAGGLLRFSPTPAMALFDVDGGLPNAALSLAGAEAAARAIRRLDVTGSIGIDLPARTKTDRVAAADAIDAILPQPFERTAVNGFGFVQIVRRRARASLPELLRADPALAAALALLRRVGREPGVGRRRLAMPPAVADRVRAEWLTELERRLGSAIKIERRASLALTAGFIMGES